MDKVNFRAEVPHLLFSFALLLSSFHSIPLPCHSIPPLVIQSEAKNLNTYKKTSSRKFIRELHSNPFMFNNFELRA